MAFLLPVLFLIIAFLYASIGFGGGSSYLALLSISDFDFNYIKTTALLCNLAVVSGNVWVFVRQAQLQPKRHVWLFALSIPMAAWGGSMQLSQQIFFSLLGCTLLLAAIAIWFQPQLDTSPTNSLPATTQLIIGGGIGFLSGLVGIGGGIFLAPILHLSRHDNSKTIAGISSLFIFINSIAGLIGQSWNHKFAIADASTTSLLLGAVIIGGQIGVRLSVSRLNDIFVKRATAVLIATVGAKLIYNQLIT